MAPEHSTSSDESEAPSVYHQARSRQTFPAMQGLMGPRLVTYATQLSPKDIVSVIGHDPRSEKHKFLIDRDVAKIYQYMQRKTGPGRREAIKAYIKDRLFPGADMVGGFPAISIAVQNPIETENIEPTYHPGVVDMMLDTGLHNKRVVLDGLGRISGAMALVDLLMGSNDLTDGQVKELGDMLDEFSFPCVFYAPRRGEKPLSAEEMGQLFHDFNFRVTPVSAKDAIALDKSDPYIRATYYLSEKSAQIASNGGMETKAASLGSKSSAVVVQPVFLRFIRAALEGEQYVEASNKEAIKKPNLTPENRQAVLDSLAEFIDRFGEAMGEKFKNRELLHLSSPGWQSIGVLHHDVTFRLQGFDRLLIAQKLAEVDWSRQGPLWADLMTEKTDKNGVKRPVLNTAGASARRAMIAKLRQHLSIPSPSDKALSDFIESIDSGTSESQKMSNAA